MTTLENRGVEPSVVVEVTPHDAVRGVDAQLKAALEEAARLCEAYDAAAERRRKAEEEAAALEAASSKEPPRQHWSLQMHR